MASKLTTVDGIESLLEVEREHRNISQEQLEIQHNIYKQNLSDKQQECLHLFRLTKIGLDISYEWYKDRTEDRVEGTCMWFLEHKNFQKWTKQESGPLLVSADPGCGKSVLAKYLINEVLPSLSGTICYFFFKDQDQNTVRQALCALLHQLFSQKPLLIQHAIKQFDKDGPGLVNSTSSLWTILGDAVQDHQAGPITIVLDALDECAELEFGDLVRNIEHQYGSSHLSQGKVKYLLTSRPYDQIVLKFQVFLDAFPNIHIPGEEESETISQEVNHVIKYRVERLGRKHKLSDEIKRHLKDQLLEITHRTYLWVYLVFDYLDSKPFKKTAKGVKDAIAILPTTIHQAYERILERSIEQSMVRKALAIILAARRPLTLSEMNVAMNIDNSTHSITDLDLEGEEDFKIRLRSWCGLFVSIHHDQVYLLHQTAREFLLTEMPLPTATPKELKWHRSITIQEAHRILAPICVRFLSFFDSNITCLADTTSEVDCFTNNPTFLEYSADFWGLHFHEAHITNDDTATASCFGDIKAKF
jgi:hypothetical protein